MGTCYFIDVLVEAPKYSDDGEKPQLSHGPDW